MQVVQKIQTGGVSVNYYPTMEQARRMGTAVTIPSAMFAQVADPRKPTQPLEIGHVAVIENKRLARWLASRCHPMFERGTLPDNKPGFRFWDDESSDVGNAPPVMAEAYKVVKAKMSDNKPMVGISNGKTGTISPLLSMVGLSAPMARR